MYKLSLSDSWITQIDTSNQQTMRKVEGHTFISFGDLIISIGGCNPLEEICNNEMWVYKVLSDQEE